MALPYLYSKGAYALGFADDWILVHTAVVAPFVLNNSKRNEGLFQLLFTINAVRLNSFSFWLRVYEIPTPTTEKRFSI